MADFGTALSVVQTFFAAQECSFLRKVFSAIDYKSDIQGLKKTVRSVNSVLLDVGNKKELSKTELDYIQKFKDAVYDADDLFDEFITLAELKDQLKDSKFSKKVRIFFSSRNPLKVAYLMSQDIKKIRRKLNNIADDRAKFGFSIETKSHKRRMEETYSSLYERDIVGREDDVTSVINRLTNSTEDISFHTIVGVGGLGKTTLAKLVFGDKRIQSQFSLRMWACVSDQGGSPLNYKEIMLRILESVEYKIDKCTSIEFVQGEFRRRFGGKKFLLVLDDVWTESSLELQNLRNFLMIGGRGSRIIATTRSRETADFIGDDTHELEGLSKENSWHLFKITAFREDSQPSDDLVEIGEKIVEKCCNVPLAIKVAGSLLRDKPIDKWRVFEACGLAGISNGLNEIMSILKYSYDHLDPSLKKCFAYCALFPKGYVINKEMLLNLWEAQDYIVPFDRGQSIESACEEHFSILLQRCFFQDVKNDEFGDVESFKMHDLMHDLAQNVSGDETRVILDTSMFNVDSNVRHLFDARYKINNTFFIKSKIRSYLILEVHEVCGDAPFPVGDITNNMVCLRALALNHLSVKKLPVTMGNLLHLRYLNLAYNDCISELPGSIVNLHNLQILNLSNCRSLRRWPKDFNKLVNLTHLHIDGCNKLNHMPVGMSKLSRLCVLTDFVVTDEGASGINRVGQLEDLKALVVNLQGQIVVRFDDWDVIRAKGYKWEGSCLKGGEHLRKVKLSFYTYWSENYIITEEFRRSEEIMMERLQPHAGLKKFELEFYEGEKISGWGRSQDNWAIFLPNLVYIELRDCKRLQQLPLLSKLLYLKSLHLNGLKKLEYAEVKPEHVIEEATKSGSSSGIYNRGSLRLRECDFTFFPSLESLQICGLDKLKGWFESGSSSKIDDEAVFRRLSQLTIIKCPDLTTFPACPSLQTLNLKGNNEALRITLGEFHLRSTSDNAGRLGLLAQTDCVDHLISLAPQLLTSLYTSNNSKMWNLQEVEEVFRNCSASLHNLEIQQYDKLTSVSEGLEHLTALTSLTLEGCKELRFEGMGNNETNGMPWIRLQHNLRSLKLDGLNNVKNLAEGMKYLTSLEHLHIVECENLNTLPEWVSCFQLLRYLQIESCHGLKYLPQAMTELTSLQKLKIYRCPDLKERCQRPTGEDWPKIQHIPRISIP